MSVGTNCKQQEKPIQKGGHGGLRRPSSLKLISNTHKPQMLDRDFQGFIFALLEFVWH